MAFHRGDQESMEMAPRNTPEWILDALGGIDVGFEEPLCSPLGRQMGPDIVGDNYTFPEKQLGVVLRTTAS